MDRKFSSAPRSNPENKNRKCKHNQLTYLCETCFSESVSVLDMMEVGREGRMDRGMDGWIEGWMDR